MIAPITDVFSYRQYSAATLDRLHKDLLKNPWSGRVGSEEHNQFTRCREEMERRGMKIQNTK